MKRKKVKKETDEFVAAVGRVLRRAAKVARKTARMHGTPIYIWKNGKSRRGETVSGAKVGEDNKLNSL